MADPRSVSFRSCRVPPRPVRSICAAVVSAAVVTAQTYVVDAAGGPGSHFTDLPTAVLSVPDGATLVVRFGGYASPTISGKGLAILADPGVALQGQVVVQNTAVGQRVALRGLRITGVAPSGPLFALGNCLGPVLLDGCSWGGLPSGLPAGTLALDVALCRQVVTRDCTWDECRVNQSNVVFENTLIRGRNGSLCSGCAFTAPALGLWTFASDITVAGGQVLGGAEVPGGGSLFPAKPGIEAHATAVRLLGPATVGIAPCSCVPTSVVPAITLASGSSLRIDPQVVLQTTAVPPIQGSLVQTVAMPHVTSTDAQPGGTLTATAPGPVGAPAILVFGFPGPILAIPGIAEEFWLDPLQHNEFAAIGLLPLGAGIGVPNSPIFLGVAVGWQSIAFDPVTLAAEVSNPSWALVR